MVIERAISPHADQVSVIYSVPDNPPEMPAHWNKVGFECFFGCKFQRALELHREGVMLQIQADAHSEDWGGLVQRVRETFTRYPDLGVWGPSVDYSMWTLDRVFLSDFDKERSLVAVRQTDGIVWALAPQVIQRMRQADYSRNRLGWGIDSLAIAFAYCHGLLVLRDTSVEISHPKGKGYGREEAAAQLEDFMGQFSFAERLMLRLTRKRPAAISTKDLLYLLLRRLLGKGD
jgi:hypothetical protein